MYSRRENVLLGYSPRRSLMNYSGHDSPKSPYRTSDVDFNDVFGGPPRRSSLQEMRHTFGDATDSSSPRNEDGALLSRPHRWSGLGEKPVFGDEVGNRRRHPSNDFFDDIFKGNEPVSSSPRKQDRDLFSSSPGSRVLSPVPPLPSRPEPFGSPLPEQFSLPAKLVKGPDLPTFGSSTRNHNRSKNDASNSSSFSYSPLSRTSNQANQNERGLTQDIRCRSSLSREFSLDDVDQPNSQKPYQSGQEINLEMDSNSSGNAGSGSQFHFSIYKWAGKGVPLPMPFRGGSATRLKEKSKLERCSSANGRMACEVTERKLSIATPCSVDSSPVIHGVSSDNTSIGVERVKEDNGFLGKVKQYEIMNESETPMRDSVIVKSIAAETASLNSREETKSHSVPDTGLRGKTEAKSPEITKKDDESGPKPLRSMLFEDNNDQDVDYPTRKNGVKENKAKNTKKSSAVFDFSDSVKKQDDRSTLNSDNINKPSLQGSLKISQNNIEKKNRGRGKVKEFVKMFNQEVPKENKVDLKSPSPSSIWKERWKPSTEDEASVNTNKIKENVPLPNVKMNNASDAFVKLQELHQEKRASKHKAADTPSIRKYVSGSKKESAPDGSEAICGDAEAFFHENFQVKELHQNEDKQQSEENLDVDTKIRRWANGKEGNIRSLLSTLQYVLWPESGWKPVPLVNIIEGNAVKRSYQKALLYLHPDKLQQKGATSEQKYIAEKVFDVLQEAWTHFNILGSV